MLSVPLKLLAVFVFFCHTFTVSNALVHKYEKNFVKQEQSVEKRASSTIRRLHKRATDDQKTCMESTDYQDKLKAHDNIHIFRNDSNPSIALTWSGTNGVIIALTTMTNGFISRASRLYRSSNRGKLFHDITSQIGTAYIRKSNGILLHPVDTSHVILVGYTSPFERFSRNTKLYITTDEAKTFEKISCPFSIDDNTVKFNPKNKYRLLTLSLNHELWLSKDFTRSWHKVATYVLTAKWDPINPDVLYFTMDPLHTLKSGSMDNELYRYNVGADVATLIAQRVHSFAVQDNFLFLSTQFSGKNGSRVMHVSKDEGKTWSAAQLPMINQRQFYSLLDMSEQMVFVHVDVDGDTGHGKIYTSDERGIIYSLSLDRHLYPNNAGVTDFYKVKSLSGVYITSQLQQDNTVHTLITFDKGGTWQVIPRPDGLSCKKEEKACNLQIHNFFSATKGVKLPSLPMSSKNTVGLILAHGNLGDGLSFNAPNVFVSRDGGYKWTAPKQLEGPHYYGIGDSGGILFAVPYKAETINTLYFSFDEGACWHPLQFSEKKIRVTGVSAEPGEKATDVSIWGWDSEGDGSWMAVVVEFKPALGQSCTTSDYVTWLAHETNSVSSLTDGGCMLGAKRTFIRRKKGSICVNADQLVPTQTSVPCRCQTADFLCDYGYKRGSNGECTQDPSFALSKQDICISDTEEEITTMGYRKIPGDLCSGGFNPPRTVANLHKSCVKIEEKKEEAGVDKNNFEVYTTGPPHNSPHTGIIVILVLCVLGLGSALVYIIYRKRFSSLKVRYTPLSTKDDDSTRKNGSLAGSTSLMDDDDEEGVLVEANGTTKPGKPAMLSYHDDSDEDLLVT